MLNISGIDHLNINVKDLEITKKFYHELFGYRVHEEGFSKMSGKKYAIIGKSNVSFLAVYETNDSANISKLNHIGFHVENFDDVLTTIDKLNLKVGDYGNELGIVEYPNSKSIYIYDPDGNELELSSKFGGGN